MKTIAEQLNIKEFPFEIRDKDRNLLYCEKSNRHWLKYEYDLNGNQTYFEDSNGYWWKSEYDSNLNLLYYENSDGLIEDNRPKYCDGKMIKLDGKLYQLKEVK
jgi:hypothetical protein